MPPRKLTSSNVIQQNWTIPEATYPHPDIHTKKTLTEMMSDGIGVKFRIPCDFTVIQKWENEGSLKENLMKAGKIRYRSMDKMVKCVRKLVTIACFNIWKQTNLIPLDEFLFWDFLSHVLSLPPTNIDSFIRAPFKELTGKTTSKLYYDNPEDFRTVKTKEGYIIDALNDDTFEKLGWKEQDENLANPSVYLLKYVDKL
jgi:hypothetical protein